MSCQAQSRGGRAPRVSPRVSLRTLGSASALLLALLSAPVLAQTAGTVDFSVQVVSSSNGTVTPKLTWNTSPQASGCTASGDWTGAKTWTGTEVLPATTKSQNFVLTCSWAATTASLTWTNPTTYTDGSALGLAKIRIYYGASASNLSQVREVAAPGTSSSFTGLAAGTWYFSLSAFDLAGVESLLTTPVSTSIGSASASKTLALAVKIPNPPSGLVAQ